MQGSKDERRQLEALIEWMDAAGEEWDPKNPSKMKNVETLDSSTFLDYCDKNFPGGVASYTAGLATRGLLGVEPDEVSALFMVDYIKAGTGVKNMISDGKDGGQYRRNRRGRTTPSRSEEYI